jgi:hypothetical protein
VERDLGRRLTLFGILAVGVGCIFLVLGLLHLLLPAMSEVLSDPRPVDAHTVWMGLLLYVSIGVVMIWAGVGSMRRRRWVRPIMLFVAGTWLIVGVFVLLLAFWMMEDLLMVAGGETVRSSPEIAAAARVAAIGAIVAGGIFSPILFIWAYRDPAIQTTCERYDSGGSWSDRCPASVLALSAALAAGGLFSLPMVLRPVLPVGGYLVTGWTGRLVLLAGIVICVVLARSVFRMERAGWWATLIFLVVLGVSTGWSFAAVDVEEMFRILGYPEDQVAALSRSETTLRNLGLGSAVLLTVAGVLYMLGVRRYFFLAEWDQT